MSKLRDKDLPARARFFQAVGWSLFPALAMGLMVTVASDLEGGLRTFGLVVVVAGGGSLLFSEVVGRTTAQILHPTAANRGRGYSGAAALAAKGRYEEAVSVYTAAAAENPGDPLPCLKAARLYTERMGQHEVALDWFREARRRDIHPGEERTVIREMVDAAERGGNGLQAAPDLARYVEERAGTDEEVWARQLLQELKSQLHDGPGDTSTHA